jgi:hypothetical protein
MYVFDSAENVNFSPRQIILPHETNVCTLKPEGGLTQLDCPETSASSRNGFEVVGSSGSFTGGWLRILDNAEGNEVDSLEALPVRRFPALGLVFSAFVGNQGAFDQSFPIEWTAVTGAGGFGGTQGYSVNGGGAPWWLPGNAPLTPGDHQTGGLPLTGP